MTDYELLKWYGFSPAKAAEIELDAQRGIAVALETLARAMITYRDHLQEMKETKFNG